MVKTSQSSKKSSHSLSRSLKKSTKTGKPETSIEVKMEAPKDDKRTLNLRMKAWAINSMFASATFITLLGMSLSGYLSVAYNVLERFQTPLDNNTSLDQIMYLLTIGSWVSVAWVVAFIILAIVFSVKPLSNVTKWTAFIAFLGCSSVMCIVSSWSTYLLNNYNGDELTEPDAILTAKYITGMTAVMSGFLFFFVLIIGLVSMFGLE